MRLQGRGPHLRSCRMHALLDPRGRSDARTHGLPTHPHKNPSSTAGTPLFSLSPPLQTGLTARNFTFRKVPTQGCSTGRRDGRAALRGHHQTGTPITFEVHGMAAVTFFWLFALFAFSSLIAPTLPDSSSPAPRFFLRLSLRGGADSAQFSVQHPLPDPIPTGPPPARAEEEGPGQVERDGPPILVDDVPNRPSVRERDEWLWLFSSMQTYKPFFPRAWVRDTLTEQGAEARSSTRQCLDWH